MEDDADCGTSFGLGVHAHDARIGVLQPHDDARERRLARAGFSDDADGFSLRNVEGDVPEGDAGVLA